MGSGQSLTVSKTNPEKPRSESQVDYLRCLDDQAPSKHRDGDSAQYQFVTVEVTFSLKVSYGFLSSSVVTCDVETYYPLLSQLYDQGFRMATFYHIPGQFRRAGFFTTNFVMPFQGIFHKNKESSSEGRYKLHVEKSVIQPEISWSGCINRNIQSTVDFTHVQQCIANNTQSGGRLICIELTGREQYKPTFSGPRRMPALGVDIFFEIPLDGSRDTYIYHAVHVPAKIHYSTGCRPVPKLKCDWSGILNQHLAQGYKLVEIFADGGQNMQTTCCSVESELNSLWFFEKSSSREHDSTQIYEGKVVEHKITISQSGLSEMKTKAKWEPIIEEMGKKGWELACILETPEVEIIGLAKITMKVLLFFQRKIIS